MTDPARDAFIERFASRMAARRGWSRRDPDNTATALAAECVKRAVLEERKSLRIIHADGFVSVPGGLIPWAAALGESEET